MSTYLYSYSYRGARYAFEIVADSKEEADGRLLAIQMGRQFKYDGELAMTIPAFPGAGLLVRFLTWLRG